MTLKQKSVDKGLVIVSYFFFQVLMLAFFRIQGTQSSQSPNENITEFKNSDKKLACASFWKSTLSLILHAMGVLGWTIQKQPPRDVPRKRCSENMQQIYWRTPMLKCDFNKIVNCDFNKVVKQLFWNRTLVWVFSCKFAAYFQTIFSW